MIKIFATPQNTTDVTQLDIIGDENINITYAIDDILVDGQKQTGYSKDFQLPATKLNNRFFKHFYNVDIETLGFDASRTVEAFIQADGVTIIDGFMQLLKVQRKPQGIFYNVVIFDAAANLLNELGDDTLGDLVLEDIVHRRYRFNCVFNANQGQFQLGTDYNNMVRSWTNTGIQTDDFGSFINGTLDLPVRTGDSTAILYPFIADGEVSDTGTEYLAQLDNFPISVQLKYILDNIFEHANFNVKSAFLNTADFKNIYFDTRVPYLQQSQQIENFVASGLGSSLTITNTAQVIPFNAEVDTDNEYNLGTNTFTAHDDLFCNLNYEGVIAIDTGFPPFQLELVASINDVTGVTTDVILDTVAIPAYNGVTTFVDKFHFVFSAQVFSLSQGSTVVFKIKSPSALLGATHQLQAVASTTGTIASPYSTLTMARFEHTTPPDIIAAGNTHMKLVDIVKDVFKLFNLVAEPTGTRALNIEPFSNYVDSGTSVNWTHKVDLSKAEIKPLSSKRSIMLEYADDNDDYYLKQHKDTAGTSYASHFLEFNPDGTGDIKIKLDLFAPAYVTEVQNLNTPIGAAQHKGKDNNGTIEAHYFSMPRLFYKNYDTINLALNMRLYDSESFVYNAPNEFIEHNTYQSAYLYSDSVYNITNNTNSLGFGIVQPYEDGAHAIPTNTLFNRFYFDYVLERYDNSDSFLYVVNIHLKASDIYNFSFANKVVIKGQEYRVNKIQYNTNKSKLAKVELYRI